MKNRKDINRIVEITLVTGLFEDVKSLINLDLDINWLDKPKKDSPSFLETLFHDVSYTKTQKNEYMKVLSEIMQRHNITPMQDKNGVSLLEYFLLQKPKIFKDDLSKKADLIGFWLESGAIKNEDVLNILNKSENKYCMLDRTWGTYYGERISDDVDNKIKRFYNENIWIKNTVISSLESKRKKIKGDKYLIWTKEEIENWVGYDRWIKTNKKTLSAFDKTREIYTYPLLQKMDDGEFVFKHTNIDCVRELMSGAGDYFNLSHIISQKDYGFVTSKDLMEIYSSLPLSEKEKVVNDLSTRSVKQNKKKGYPGKLIEGVMLYHENEFLAGKSIKDLAACLGIIAKHGKMRNLFFEKIKNTVIKYKIKSPWMDEAGWGVVFENMKDSGCIDIGNELFLRLMDEGDLGKQFDQMHEYIFKKHHYIKTNPRDKYAGADDFLSYFAENLILNKKLKTEKSEINSLVWHCVLRMRSGGSVGKRWGRKILFYHNNKNKDERFDVFNPMSFHAYLGDAFDGYENKASQNLLGEAIKDNVEFNKLVFKQSLVAYGVVPRASLKKRII